MSRVQVNSGFKVMAIDDDPYMLEIAVRLLEQHGHKVTPVNDAKTALFLVPQVAPDVILLDISMPVMDGFAFLKEIKNKPRWNRVPIFMMTGNMDRESVQTALNLGAVDYLTKPVDPVRLMARLDKLLKARQQEEAHRGIAWGDRD